MLISTNFRYIFTITKTKVLSTKNSENCILPVNLYITSRNCAFYFIFCFSWLQQNNLMQAYSRAAILQWDEKESRALREFHKEQLISRDSTHCHQNFKVHCFVPPHLSTQGNLQYSAASRTLAKSFNAL